MDYIVPISEARGKLPAFLKKMSRLRKHLVITVNGRAEAIVMTPEEFETLEIKADRELLLSIIRGEEDIKRKKLYSHSDVFKNV